MKSRIGKPERRIAPFAKNYQLTICEKPLRERGFDSASETQALAGARIGNGSSAKLDG
jgi:hypothetical protein